MNSDVWVDGVRKAKSGDRILLGSGAKVTLPKNPKVGDIVEFIPAGDWEKENSYILRNGSLVNGVSEDLVLDIKLNFAIRYSGKARGWVHWS